jgi:hypothetical protein
VTGVEAELKVEDKDDTTLQRTFILPVRKGPADARLANAGLELAPQAMDGRIEIVDIVVDSPAERARLDVADTNHLLGIEVRNPQPAKEWFALPALLLLAAVVVAQRRRRQRAATPDRLPSTNLAKSLRCDTSEHVVDDVAMGDSRARRRRARNVTVVGDASSRMR